MTARLYLPLLAALSLGAGPALAAPAPAVPPPAWPAAATGLWSFSAVSGEAAPPMSGRICLGPKLLDNMTARFAKLAGKGCEVGKPVQDGAVLRLDMTCRLPLGDKVMLTAHVQASRAEYEVHMVADSQIAGAGDDLARPTHTSADYVWIGACPDGMKQGVLVTDNGQSFDMTTMQLGPTPKP